jgi:hypothetical protein
MSDIEPKFPVRLADIRARKEQAPCFGLARREELEVLASSGVLDEIALTSRPGVSTFEDLRAERSRIIHIAVLTH